MRNVALLLRKDARILARSRVLVAACVVYPLFMALLVGLVVRFAGDQPRVALVDNDDLPEELVVSGQRFDIEKVIQDIEGHSELVPLSGEEAERQLEAGRVVAVVVVPPGFAARLRSMAESPRLVLKTARGSLRFFRSSPERSSRARAGSCAVRGRWGGRRSGPPTTAG